MCVGGGGGGGGFPPAPYWAPTICPPTLPLRAPASFNGICNRPQLLRQPPPTACLTASGAASEAPSLLMHPWGGGGGLGCTPGGLMMDHWNESGSRFLFAAPVSTTDAPGLTLFFNGVNETFSPGSDLRGHAGHIGWCAGPHPMLRPRKIEGKNRGDYSAAHFVGTRILQHKTVTWLTTHIPNI